MAASLEHFGTGGIGKRRLHLLQLASPEALADVTLVFEKHASVLLAWNAQDASAESVSEVVERLLDQGAVSISCWGEDCRRVHDTFDETITAPGASSSRYSSSVMTTWHARERFEEVLWYALFVAQPTDLFERSCRDSLVVLIGCPELAEPARKALADPDAFSSAVLADEP